MKRFLFLTTMLLALVARPAFATSIILVTGNTSFNVSWLYTPTNPDLSASAHFTITNFTTTGFDLTVDQVANTTPSLPNISARMTSFGFGLGPDATGHSNIDNGLVFSWGFSNFPGFGGVDACGYAGNNCAGGANAGLLPGQSQPGDMSIHFTGPFTNGVTLSDFGIKFQTGEGSYEFAGCVTDCGGSDRGGEAAVPEPASMALLGTGLVLGAARLRRTRRQAQ